MSESPSMAGYEWMPFYLSNLFNDLCNYFAFDINHSPEFITLSYILAAGMYESEVNNWLKALKSAMYEVEDLQDRCQILENPLKIGRQPRKGTESVTYNHSQLLVGPFEKFIKKLMKVPSQRKRLFCQFNRLRDLISEATFYSGALGILDHPLNANQFREMSSVLQTGVFGCDNEREPIIKLLLEQMDQNHKPSSSKTYSTLAIIGPPGCGKTTLAQYIFNDVRMASQFETRIWLCLSDQKLDIYNNMSVMVKSVSLQEFLALKKQEVLQCILGHDVQSTATLFILDDFLGISLEKETKESTNSVSSWNDAWHSGLESKASNQRKNKFVNEQQWEQLLDRLSLFSRCKILITSESPPKSLPLCSTCTFSKNPMEEKDLYLLLKHCAFEDHKGMQLYIPPDIERIAHEIVKRLQYPAEAKLIGSQLRARMDADAWEKMLERVKVKILPELNPKPTDIYLQFNEPLKRCFLFCTIFPIWYKHEMNNLVDLWVAERFIKSQDPDKSAEEIGKGYFEQLLSFSVFKAVHDQESDNMLYTMDGVFHCLADHLSADDCFRLEVSDGIAIPSSIFHLSVHSAKLMEHKSNICRLNNLRTLIIVGPIINGSDGTYEILEEIFSNLKRLRVLDISVYTSNNLPKTIGYLKHLQYLNLAATTVTKLPKFIHKLHNLQFLKYNRQMVKDLSSNKADLGNLQNGMFNFTLSRWICICKNKIPGKEVHDS